MSIVEVKKKWGVAPAFNLEFVAYYEDRERRIEALKKQVAQDKKDFEDLRNQESEVTLKFNQIQKILNELSGVNDDLRQKVEDFRALLGMGGLEIPKTVSKVSLSKLSSTEPTSVAIKARSTAYSSALSLQVTICDEKIFFVFIYTIIVGIIIQTCQKLWYLRQITRSTFARALRHLPTSLPFGLFNTTFESHAQKIQTVRLVLFRMLSRLFRG